MAEYDSNNNLHNSVNDDFVSNDSGEYHFNMKKKNSSSKKKIQKPGKHVGRVAAAVAGVAVIALL
ncbi:MAG: hypothetical protein J6K26_09100, partial [Lachnospiraceae bacterium]|nr:hypothetical protein [Lachnospiraceae bacterium]